MNRLSIRWRITLWNTVAVAVILLGFGLAVYGLLRKTHYDQVDRWLLARFHEIAGIHTDRQGSGGWLAGSNGGDLAYVLDQGGHVIEHTGALSPAEMVAVSATGADASHFNTDQLPELGHVRRLAARIPNVDSQRTLVILRKLDHVDEELWEVTQSLLITTPIALLAAASIAYVLARKALAPVDELRRMTDEITAQRLDRRLPIANSNDELGLLAQTVNSMIARLERSFNEVRRFTADVSHELRTPVTVIRSEAELGLTATDNPDSVRKRFESIVEECSRLADLTTQLLALCRDDAGVTQVIRRPVRLAALISESTDIMRPLAVAKQQQLSVEVEDDLVILADAERVRQVFCNLVDNAIKYTPAGGAVTVTLRRQNGHALVTVRDTGIGIAAEHLSQIFDRFYQVKSGRVQAGGGAGLGLSIVKSIVEAHSGRIEVESTLGAGSVFRVFLPKSPNSSQPDHDETSAIRAGFASSSPTRIGISERAP